MNLKINSIDGLEITDEIKDIIQKKFIDKLDLLLAHFNEEMKTSDLNIAFDKRYKIYKVKFDMNLPGPGQIFSETTHHNLIAAIIDLREQIEKQIKKYKSDLTNYSVG